VLWLPPGQTLNGPVCSFVFCAHYSAYVPTYYNVDDTVVVMLELRGHVLLDLMQARRSQRTGFRKVQRARAGGIAAFSIVCSLW
jgi:hypothetical protein